MPDNVLMIDNSTVIIAVAPAPVDVDVSTIRFTTCGAVFASAPFLAIVIFPFVTLADEPKDVDLANQFGPMFESKTTSDPVLYLPIAK